MKKYILGILALAGLLSFSCNDYLDIPTENSSPVIGIDYSNADNLFLPLSAAYASMRNNDAFAMPYYSMFEVASDNADKGSDSWDAPAILDIDSIRFDPGNYLFNNIWVASFNIVSASNYAIESMDKFMTALPTEKDRLTAKAYQGEAKFIRAYAFFNLVRLFGRVPIVDKSYTADELSKLPQSNTLDIYKFIQQDLVDAMAVLPTAYSYNQYPGRTTVYTAAALKAKVHMYLASVLKAEGQPYQAQWDSVAVLTDKVISSNLFELLPAFRTYFSLAGKNSKESIFEIQCSTLGNTSGGEELKAFVEYAFQQGPRGNEPGNMQGFGLCV
ncbi:MAG: RagB/SusD family nutrient uptake outer membrane protein, partial [Bacteroidales bacterium]